MLCPSCSKSETQVIDSRDDGKIIRRRRACGKCNYRFTTYERIEIPKLSVIKKDKRKEPFIRNKIITGIQKACEKRPIKEEEIEGIVDKIEQSFFEKGEKEVESRLIGQMVMEELKKLDPVAYLRFASVYRAFKDVESFEREVHKVIKK